MSTHVRATRALVPVLLFPLVLVLTSATRECGQVHGTVLCQAPDGSVDVTFAPRGLPIHIDGVGDVTTDADGGFTIAAPQGFRQQSVNLDITYAGSVTSSNVTTTLSVLNDSGANRHDRVPATGTTEKTNGLALDTVTLDAQECELWRIGTKVLDDYHQVKGASPPSGGLKFVRPAGVFFGAEYTPYDVIRVRTDMFHFEPTFAQREHALFHEFGHTLRHVWDADHERVHWDCDDVRWFYGRSHHLFGVANMQFAFNEGWAEYWELARARGRARFSDPTVPPRMADERDWVEAMVGNAMMDLANKVKTTKHFATDDEADAFMLSVQENPANAKKIHSFHAFEVALNAALGLPAPAEPPLCPPGYDENPTTCIRNAVVEAKPSQARIGHAPTRCDDGRENSLGLCYPPCAPGEISDGAFCREPCPTGFDDDGVTCRKDVIILSKSSFGRGVGTPPTHCSAGRHKEGDGLCYTSCGSDFTGVGPTCLQNCPDGFVDDGLTCRRPGRIENADNSQCPWYDMCGLTFARGCSHCPNDDFHNDGCTCRIDPLIRGKQSFNRGVGTLPSVCDAGDEKSNGLCYPACARGFSGSGPLCLENCPDDFHDDGLTCRQDAQIIPQPSHGRGIGTVPTVCNEGEDKIAGLCYPPCPTDMTAEGAVCWGECDTGFRDDGATCYIGTHVVLKSAPTCEAPIVEETF